MPVLRPLSPRKPPKNGHRARSENANTGSPAASLWKSCFAETVDKHLSLPLTATSYPFRFSEIGLNLKELGHRLPSTRNHKSLRRRPLTRRWCTFDFVHTNGSASSL